MSPVRFAGAAFALAVLASPLARGQEPPPPPTNLPPQYVPPPTPQQLGPAPAPPQQQPAPRREPPRREREREHEREPAPPPRRVFVPPPPPPPPPSRDEPPPAAHGFQLALRTGLSLPVGDISGQANDAMSKDFALQVPLFLEIGAKVHPMIFLGAYTALSLGGTSSDFANDQGCGKGGRSCIASSLRLGIEVQVHFQPAERMDPWVGYGIGIESTSASATGGGVPQAGESFTGFELARLAGGVDFRLSRLFGIGPYAELAFGTYSHVVVQGFNGQKEVTVGSDIPESALHAWPTIGLRGVFFP